MTAKAFAKIAEGLNEMIEMIATNRDPMTDLHALAARAEGADQYQRAIAALEACLAAMNAMASEAAGDMTDGDYARLWNAATAMADAVLADRDAALRAMAGREGV